MRTPEEVRRLQASVQSCCSTHADMSSCNCLEEAVRHQRAVRREKPSKTKGAIMSEHKKVSEEIDREWREAMNRNKVIRNMLSPNFPTIVCLCGSTRFMDEWQKANLSETLAGRIVLSIGCNTKSDADLQRMGNLTAEKKVELDELHKRKIDLSDEILVLNVQWVRCGNCKAWFGPKEEPGCSCPGHPYDRRELVPYIGTSTQSEIEYARAQGKVVRFLNPE